MAVVPSQPPVEGFVDIDGQGFYAIPNVDRLGPFLMSIVSDSDHWMFVSSGGGLTAGRGESKLALFPYETDDRLHVAAGVTGPVTLIRPAGGETVWEPFGRVPTRGAHRNLYKSVVGNQVIFEEVHPGLELVFRYRWSTSDRFGFVRTVTLGNVGDSPAAVELVDGLLNILPYGLDPSLYQRMSNLANAYKRSEIVDPDARLAIYSLEARVVDRAEPAEALIASIAWSEGLPGAEVGVDPGMIEAFRVGGVKPVGSLLTGQAGAYLTTAQVEIGPGAEARWTMVADVNQSQTQVVELLGLLRSATSLQPDLAESVRQGSDSLEALLAPADAFQRAGDRMATAHHFSNVMYNVMRGGVFVSNYLVDTGDFAAFLSERNRDVPSRHKEWLDALPEELDRTDLIDQARASGDPHLIRLSLEYLPLTFSRRHGDPSRPWNAFSIRVRDDQGEPIVHYEGNWRDIFQNWEALCQSFPEYLPGVVAVFLNASTADGFNPYRITRDGFEWEVPEPDNPWSNIGYWGDHQIVYLLRLLEGTRRFRPGALDDLLDQAWFSYADVPYRIVSYEELVGDPKATIRFDLEADNRSTRRVEELGQDGKLLTGSDGEVYLVGMVEKLLVPALSKLSNFVPGGGIWMNTQRPEWNDANNALVGHGVSMVTLSHLRRYLEFLGSLLSGREEVDLSIEVADWMAAIASILAANDGHLGKELTDELRRTLVDALGGAFSSYRARIYSGGFSGRVPVAGSDVRELCKAAVAHLDDTVRRNRRPDGLYHSYNLVHFGEDGSTARIEHLDEMLEGQVAVLSAGFLTPEEQLSVLESLFSSSMYRPDQNSFMLYPARRLPSFLEKNVVPRSRIGASPLFQELLGAGDDSIVVVDAEGRYRFNAQFRNQSDLEAALDRLAADERWGALVAEHRRATLDTYEQVFQHHAYAGRSESMYGYEGIGSIYWHMVAKLLVAAQEGLVEAAGQGVAAETLGDLIGMYWRIRGGLGFEKTAHEFGAFPVDAYSHTPAHAGAQQPGMTGQVKEEILTRPLELGLRVENGEIRFDPILLRPEEFLSEPEGWHVRDLRNSQQVIELPAGSFGMTVCQVPVIVAATEGSACIEVDRSDGSRSRLEGLHLDRETSEAIFRRTGDVVRLQAYVPWPAARAEADQ